MHTCGDRIIELFSGRGGAAGGSDSPVSMDTSLWNNPARLCYTVRQGLKEAAVAGAKLLLLCDLFAKRKCQLSRQERHDIMKQAKSHMPVFLKQLHKFLLVLKQQSQSLTAQQRYDVASYLVPEVRCLWWNAPCACICVRALVLHFDIYRSLKYYSVKELFIFVPASKMQQSEIKGVPVEFKQRGRFTDVSPISHT